MKIKMPLFLLLLAFVFTACTKDSSEDNNDAAKIKFTIDGVEKTFNANSTALRYDEAGNYSVEVFGFEQSRGTEHISLSMVGNNEIHTGDYTEDGGNDEADTKIAVITYGNDDEDLYVSDDSDINPARITITAISATSVQGTFSGEAFLFDGTGTSTEKKSITHGTFNVEF